MSPTRRSFLASAAVGALAPAAFAQSALPRGENRVDLLPLNAPDEKTPETPAFEPPDHRTGYAIVGLGHLALEQILPGFAQCKFSKPVALVSGHRDKALKVAAQYGIAESSIYSYENYEQLAHNPAVDVIYIVLPNAMHAEYVIRGAKMGKHILCEKPMATSATDCERMITACRDAYVKLMVAYRQQYEPHNRAAVKLLRSGKLGAMRQFIASNGQDNAPGQWRLVKAMAGGGPLPDVGIYCINAARFLSNEEPHEVIGSVVQPKGDPRFAEVEASCEFLLRFPSGLTAVCSSAYWSHKSQFYRVECEKGFAQLSPAFGYSGNKLTYQMLENGEETSFEPKIEEKQQFALEMDHFSMCVQQNLAPHTPGEEGLQDQRIVEAIYESARTGRPVKLADPGSPTRGPEPVS